MRETNCTLARLLSCLARVAFNQFIVNRQFCACLISAFLVGLTHATLANNAATPDSDETAIITVPAPGTNVDPGTPASGPIGLADDLAEHDFDAFDEDGNGEISEQERPTEPLMTEKRFNTIDSNADGIIDRFEFEDFRNNNGE